MTQIRRVARMTDRQILKLIDALVAELSGKVQSLQISGVAVDRDSEAVADLSKGKDIGAISAVDFRVSEERVFVKFRRGIGGTAIGIDNAERTASPYFDEIEIGVERTSQPQRPFNTEIILQAQRLVIEHTRLPSDGAVVGSAAEASDLLKLQFAQLNEQLSEVNAAAFKRREELESEYSEKRRHFEDELARNAEQVRDKVAELEENHKHRLEELEDRERQLDDRDHIHVRRQLRTHITDAIATQLKEKLVPPNASRMRWSIFCLMMLGAASLAGLSAWSLHEFGRIISLASTTSENAPLLEGATNAISQVDRGFHWLVLLRGFAAGAVAIAFLLYAISWLKRVYHDEVSTRRELQRYATDLNRASWAIETIMEAKSGGEFVIPDAIIAGMTRNLFDSQKSGSAAAETSANALAELLRTSGRARFGPNGAEFELSGRGANRLADKIDQ